MPRKEKTMFEVQIMEQSNNVIIEYSMEYMSTSSLHDTDMGGSTLSRHSLGLKGLNLSIFHHWCNHTNVDLVHHIQSYVDTNTNSKYPQALQCIQGVHDYRITKIHRDFLVHSSSKENSFNLYLFEIITYLTYVVDRH